MRIRDRSAAIDSSDGSVDARCGFRKRVRLVGDRRSKSFALGLERRATRPSSESSANAGDVARRRSDGGTGTAVSASSVEKSKPSSGGGVGVGKSAVAGLCMSS